MQEDCDKREKENCRKAEEFRNEFHKGCKNLGIGGGLTEGTVQEHALRKQIIGLLDDLPETYAKLADESKKLEPYRCSNGLNDTGPCITRCTVFERFIVFGIMLQVNTFPSFLERHIRLLEAEDLRRLSS